MNTHRLFGNPSARLFAERAGVALLGLFALSSSEAANGAHAGFVSGQSAAVVLGQAGFSSDSVAVSRRGENGPSAVGFDHFGNMWVSDQCNSRLLEFKPPFVDGMAASLVIGEPDFATSSTPGPCFTAIQPPTTAAVFYYSDKFAFDEMGDLWVADAFDNRVLEFMPPFATGMSPVLVIGQSDFTSGAPAASAKALNTPTEPTFDAYGDLWVADIGNNRVLEFKPPFTTGMSASRVLGQKDFHARDCATARNRFCAADSIAFDYLGNLWVADAFVNNRILEFTPPFRNDMPASLVIGQKDFVSRAASAGRAGLNFTQGSGITFGEHGSLWVGDSGNNRVLAFAPPFATGMVATRVLGQDTFRTTIPATTASGMWIPVRPAFDLSDNLWVPDANNNRVLGFKYNP